MQINNYKVKFKLIITKIMSKMMTLADLKARDGNNNSESFGFEVSRNGERNKCI